MFAKLFTILLVILPPSLSFAANPKPEILREHLIENPKDSNALYNLALVEHKAGNLALTLALAEKSTFINPLNLSSIKLKSLVRNKLREQSSEQIESIPILYQVLDFIPFLFLLLFAVIMLILFAYILGATYHAERISFKTQPKKRLQSGLAALTFVLSLSLLFLKVQSQVSTWACILSKEANLYTGPDADKYPQVSSLSVGNCSKVVLESGPWISLAPTNKASGWTLKRQVLIVRGNKFDPLFKTD